MRSLLSRIIQTVLGTAFLCGALAGIARSHDAVTIPEATLWTCEPLIRSESSSPAYRVIWLSSPRKQSALFVQRTRVFPAVTAPIQTLERRSEWPNYSFLEEHGDWVDARATLSPLHSRNLSLLLSDDTFLFREQFPGVILARGSGFLFSYEVELIEQKAGGLHLLLKEKRQGERDVIVELNFPARNCIRRQVSKEEATRIRGTARFTDGNLNVANSRRPIPRFSAFSVTSRRNSGLAFLVRHADGPVRLVSDSHVFMGSDLTGILGPDGVPLDPRDFTRLNDDVDQDLIAFAVNNPAVIEKYGALDPYLGPEIYRNLWMVATPTADNPLGVYGPLPVLKSDGNRIRIFGTPGAGFSGGPLVDDHGRLVAIYQRYEAFGFESFALKSREIDQLLARSEKNPVPESKTRWDERGLRTLKIAGVTYQEPSILGISVFDGGGGAVNGGGGAVNGGGGAVNGGVAANPKFVKLPVATVFAFGVNDKVRDTEIWLPDGMTVEDLYYLRDGKKAEFSRRAIEMFLDGALWTEVIRSEASSENVREKHARDPKPEILEATSYSVKGGVLRTESPTSVRWTRRGSEDILELTEGGMTREVAFALRVQTTRAYGQEDVELRGTPIRKAKLNYRINRTDKSFRLSLWIPGPGGPETGELWILER